MNTRRSPTLFVQFAAGAILLASCGGGEAEVAATTTTSTTSTTTTTATSTTEVDERSDEEIALDQLDLMLVQLGVQADLVEVADCVIDRLDAEGIELVGQGTPELIAALACEPSVGQTLFNVENLPLPTDQATCVIDGISGWLGSLPLTEAEELIGQTPPEELLEELSGDCDVALEELRAALG